MFEDEYFHWITNRAIRDLIEEDFVRTETRELATGGTIKLLWHKTYRYYRRAASSVVSLVERYANPAITGALGYQGEAMVFEGFARHRFIMEGRDVRSHQGVTWNESDHDLDFIFERDGVAYGIEVKNILGYMPDEERKIKMRMCSALGLRPVFAVRMFPAHWINEVAAAGGFSVILKYQLYPWGHRELAREVNRTFGLPVDSPRALEEGTMRRFLRWHARNV